MADHDAIPTDLPKIGTRGVAIICLLVLAVLAGLFAVGYIGFFFGQLIKAAVSM